MFDVKKIQGALQGAVDAAASAVKDSGVPDVISDIKVPGEVTGLIDAAKDGIAKIKVPNPVTGIVDVVRGNGSGSQQTEAQIGISVEDTLRVFYFLMSADGSLHEDEVEKFNAIFDEIGSSCSLSKEELVASCEEQLEVNASSISPLIPAMTCVDQTLLSAYEIEEGEVPISPKLLVWDLFAVAFSDGSCDPAERELINHVARFLDVDETTLMEMESSTLAIYDIERELDWVKTTDRPYLAVESVVNELESRKAAAFEGVQALISL